MIRFEWQSESDWFQMECMQPSKWKDSDRYKSKIEWHVCFPTFFIAFLCCFFFFASVRPTSIFHVVLSFIVLKWQKEIRYISGKIYYISLRLCTIRYWFVPTRVKKNPTANVFSCNKLTSITIMSCSIPLHNCHCAHDKWIKTVNFFFLLVDYCLFIVLSLCVCVYLIRIILSATTFKTHTQFHIDTLKIVWSGRKDYTQINLMAYYYSS